jgi:hypothetical protein
MNMYAYDDAYRLNWVFFSDNEISKNIKFITYARVSLFYGIFFKNKLVLLFAVCFPGVTTHCGCISTACERALFSSFSRFLDHTHRRATVGRVINPSQRQHTTLTTDRHPCPGGIRTHNLSGRAAEDLRLRPRGHWNRQIINVCPCK